MPLKIIDAKTLKSWLDNNEVVIVDVREPAEHEAQNIPGSVLLPLGKICKAVLPNAHGKKLVIHCLSGKRSEQACEKILAEDPSLEIYNLEGGINAWSSLNKTINTSG